MTDPTTVPTGAWRVPSRFAVASHFFTDPAAAIPVPACTKRWTSRPAMTDPPEGFPRCKDCVAALAASAARAAGATMGPSARAAGMRRVMAAAKTKREWWTLK